MIFPRKKTYVLVAILGVAVALIVDATITHARLRAYRAFIVREYANELDQIEAALMERPRDWDPGADSDNFWPNPVQKQLHATFRNGDFYTAILGIGSVGFPDGGFYRHEWITVGDREGGELLFGTSFSGKKLLIYRQWLPRSPQKESFKLVFYRDAVDARMLKQKDSEPGVGADSR